MLQPFLMKTHHVENVDRIQHCQRTSAGRVSQNAGYVILCCVKVANWYNEKAKERGHENKLL